MDEELWYFAYGGNMSRAVIARRGLAPRSSEAGRLDGFRLRFSHPGLIPVEPVFANIEAAPGQTVHGVLHRLTRAELERLDRYEGAEYRHVEVEVAGARSGRVRARAYLDPHPVEGRRPSRRYLRALVDGAREHELPAAWIRELEAQPSLHVPLLSDAVTAMVGAAERLRRAGLRPERLRMAVRSLRRRLGRRGAA